MINLSGPPRAVGHRGEWATQAIDRPGDYLNTLKIGPPPILLIADLVRLNVNVSRK